MKLFSSLIPLALAASTKKVSEPTTVTLNVDKNTKLIYSYYTLVENEQYFLVGDLLLKGVNTLHFVDSTPDNLKSVRMSVGWRNPMEDAYDVTSFNMIYDRDASKIEYIAEDGYAWGAIDSTWYGYKWDTSTKTGTGAN